MNWKFQLCLLVSLIWSQLGGGQSITVRGRYHAHSINSIMQQGNDLWVATGGGGLCLYDVKQRKLIHQYHALNSPLKSSTVRSLAIDKQRKIHFLHAYGIFVIEDRKLKPLQAFPPLDGTMKRPKDYLKRFEFDAQNRLWLYKVRQLQHYSGGKLETIQNDSVIYRYKSMLKTDDRLPNFVGVDNERGLYTINDGQLMVDTTASIFKRAKRIVLDKNNHVWGLTHTKGMRQSNLLFYNGKEATCFENIMAEGCSYRIQNLVTDREKNVYVIESGIILRYDGQQWKKIARMPLELLHDQSMFIDDNNHIWVFPRNGNPQIWNGQEWEKGTGDFLEDIVTKEQSLYSDEEWYYFKNANGLFACKDGTCNQLYKSPPNRIVGHFFTFGNGEKRFMKTHDSRRMEVYRVTPTQLELIAKPKKYEKEYFRGMSQRGDSIFFVNASNQIRYFNPYLNRFTTYRQNIGLKPKKHQPKPYRFTNQQHLWEVDASGFREYDGFGWHKYPVRGRRKTKLLDKRGLATDPSSGWHYTVMESRIYRFTKDTIEEFVRLPTDMWSNCKNYDFAFDGGKGVFLSGAGDLGYYDFATRQLQRFSLPNNKSVPVGANILFDTETQRLLCLTRDYLTEFDFGQQKTKHDNYLEKFGAKLTFSLRIETNKTSFSDSLNLRLYGLEKGTAQLEVFNEGGERVEQQTIRVQQIRTPTLFAITGRGKSRGKYYLRLRQKEQLTTLTVKRI